MEKFMRKNAEYNKKKLEQALKLKEHLESYVDILNQLIEKNTKKDDRSQQVQN